MEVRYFHTGKYKFALQLQQQWRTDLARILLGGVNQTTQIPIFIRLLELIGFLGQENSTVVVGTRATTKGIATRLIRRGCVASDCLKFRTTHWSVWQGSWCLAFTHHIKDVYATLCIPMLEIVLTSPAYLSSNSDGSFASKGNIFLEYLFSSSPQPKGKKTAHGRLGFPWRQLAWPLQNPLDDLQSSFTRQKR